MTSPEATSVESERSEIGEAPAVRSGVPLRSGTVPAERAPAARIPWDTGLVGYWSLSIQQRRFICKYFSHLDTEYEALCPDEYKLRTNDKAAALRAAHLKRPGWDLNHAYEYLVMGGLPALVLNQRCVLYRERLVALLGDTDGLKRLAEAFPPVSGDDVERQRLTAIGMLSEIQRLRKETRG